MYYVYSVILQIREQTVAGLLKPCSLKTSCVPCRPAVDLLEEIKMLNQLFKLNDKRVRDANNALEDSMDTRQKAKHKLSMCSGKGDLVPLEKKTEDLNVTDLNRKVGNCHMTCSEACNSLSAQPLISLRTSRHCFSHVRKSKIHFKRRNHNKPHTPT